VQVIVLIFVLVAATEQLGLNLSFLTTNVLLVVAAVLLILSLSFVLGARTLLENILACQQLKRQISIDQRISVENVSGRVKSFTIGSVVVATEQGDAVIPAVNFFKHTYTILQ